MVAVLVKIFGAQHLQLAEDVVQDALLKALEVWKYRGMPDNPRAWLYRTARNKAIDVIRREKHSRQFDFTDSKRQLLTSEYTLASTMDDFWTEKQIKDDFLAMMFACCHPEISRINQITFILKTLCGFSTREVARAFLTSEKTITKRLYRTKEFFREGKTRPEIPSPEEIGRRTGAVLSAVYLMFNESYSSTHSDRLIREDLMTQAMFLCRSLVENETTCLPEVYALMALICFHSARSSSRISPEGELVLLPDQDRSRWDRALINLGNDYLNKAAFGDVVSTYHLEAAIAFEHCTAASFEETNWRAILSHYDRLLDRGFDSVVFLNRCIVLMELEGPGPALNELGKGREAGVLESYCLYHAALGEIYFRLGESEKAHACLNRAKSLTHSVHERKFIEERIATIKS